jgi:hypothetical protein
MTRTSRTFARWLALLAMALNALWPVIANAKPGYADLAKEVCSVTRHAIAGTGNPSDAPQARHLTPHCAFCTTGNDNSAIPVRGSVPTVDATTAEESRPNIDASCAPAPLGYTPAHPRAPPPAS